MIKKRFTLAELIALITILVCIVCMSFPFVLTNMQAAKLTLCKSNLSTLGNWTSRYTEDNNGVLPAYEDGWVKLISQPAGKNVDQYTAPVDEFACPDQDYIPINSSELVESVWRGSNYGINQHIASNRKLKDGKLSPYWTQANIKKITATAEVKILMADSAGGNYFGEKLDDPTVAGVSRTGTNYLDAYGSNPARPFPYLRHKGGVLNILYLNNSVSSEKSYVEFMLGRGTEGYKTWHAEHWYPDIGVPDPSIQIKKGQIRMKDYGKRNNK
ncbi:MAG: hypothetical protein HRT89_13495 [Lentisphaeria bacterium]|nr:hypothetical protein [Lentisphaeria bacterium]NQZ69072.1 hypothetical protein [Lentisphaeria bacterium]